MAAAGDSDLEQLPAPGALLRPKDHKDGTAGVFANLRTFLLQGRKRGDLQEVGRLVGEGYRCAAVSFIKRESVGGPRSQHAKDLLKILAEVPEWAPQAEMSLSDLEAEADKAKDQLAPAVSAAALRAALATTKESLGSLPAQGRLEDPEDINVVFMSLYKWIMDRKKTAPSLADAAGIIGAGHRQAILNFLRDVLERKNAMGQRCREVLKLLATSEEWCAGLDVDQTAVAEALAHSKDLRVQGLGAEVVATVSAPGFGSGSSAEAATLPCVRRAHTDAGSTTEAARGLPSRSTLEDPRADAGEVFRALKDGVRGRSRAGQLDQLAAELPLEHRRSIFVFLMSLVGKNIDFQEQVWQLVGQLKESKAWTDGLGGLSWEAGLAAPVTRDCHGGQDDASWPGSTAETPISPSLSLADYENIFSPPTSKQSQSAFSFTPACEPANVQAARAAHEAHVLQKGVWS